MSTTEVSSISPFEAWRRGLSLSVPDVVDLVFPHCERSLRVQWLQLLFQVERGEVPVSTPELAEFWRGIKELGYRDIRLQQCQWRETRRMMRAPR